MTEALIVTGTVACFRRPEFIRDAISYDVITPFAARGLFEAAHWTPAIRWHIERIEVINPIRTRRFEQDGGRASSAGRCLDLIDVSYAIHARFEIAAAAGPDDNVAQHVSIFRRRVKGQRFFRAPYLGRRGLRAEVRLADPDRPLPSAYADSGRIDLGWMLYDRDIADPGRSWFFRATMVDGVIDVSAVDDTMLFA